MATKPHVTLAIIRERFLFDLETLSKQTVNHCYLDWGIIVIKDNIRSRAPSQYPKRRLFVRSRKLSKPRDWYFKLSYRFEIWQAHRQHCCRSACQISERSDNSKYKSRGFEALRDLTERRLFGYWDGPLVPGKHFHFPNRPSFALALICHYLIIDQNVIVYHINNHRVRVSMAISQAWF